MATKTAGTKIAPTTVKTRVLTMAETTKKSVQRTPAPTKKALGLFPEPSETDVNGSYTGRPQNKPEVPVQDADDL